MPVVQNMSFLIFNIENKYMCKIFIRFTLFVTQRQFAIKNFYSSQQQEFSNSLKHQQQKLTVTPKNALFLSEQYWLHLSKELVPMKTVGDNKFSFSPV